MKRTMEELLAAQEQKLITLKRRAALSLLKGTTVGRQIATLQRAVKVLRDLDEGANAHQIEDVMENLAADHGVDL